MRLADPDGGTTIRSPGPRSPATDLRRLIVTA
jgi:hypothetical protein